MNDSVEPETPQHSDAANPSAQPDPTPDGTDIPVRPENAAQDEVTDGEDLVEQLARAQGEVEQLRDQALRAHAELDNVRRRAERDVTKAHKFGLERIMVDLLEVVDSMERGLLAAEAEQVSVEQLKEGTELTHKLLDKVLDKHGLTEVSPVGEAFDPEFHEALSMMPTQDVAPNTVVQVVQKGYLLNDRLIRPARVIVAQQP